MDLCWLLMVGIEKDMHLIGDQKRQEGFQDQRKGHSVLSLQGNWSCEERLFTLQVKGQ